MEVLLSIIAYLVTGAFIVGALHKAQRLPDWDGVECAVGVPLWPLFTMFAAGHLLTERYWPPDTGKYVCTSCRMPLGTGHTAKCSSDE